jgi:hypothetical protein
LVPQRRLATVEVAHAVHDVQIEGKGGVAHYVERGAAVRLLGGGTIAALHPRARQREALVLQDGVAVHDDLYFLGDKTAIASAVHQAARGCRRQGGGRKGGSDGDDVVGVIARAKTGHPLAELDVELGDTAGKGVGDAGAPVEGHRRAVHNGGRWNLVRVVPAGVHAAPHAPHVRNVEIVWFVYKTELVNQRTLHGNRV